MIVARTIKSCAEQLEIWDTSSRTAPVSNFLHLQQYVMRENVKYDASFDLGG